jgi:hypothetical protein
MIDERHMTTEGMKAAMEAQMLAKPFDWAELGKIHCAPEHRTVQRRHYNGTVGALMVARLKNIIGTMQANGYKIELWLGSGWFSKPYTITAYPDDFKIVSHNLGMS